jgi:molybdopterin-guanine dinucleotide biosynthesis protein A
MPTLSDQSPANLHGVILAGGDGVRLGQGPKAMVTLAGRALIEHVIERLLPQLSKIAIGVRAHTPWSGTLSHEVIIDDAINAGPLAGVAAALSWAGKKSTAVQAVLTCPTDIPFVPRDLAARLLDNLTNDIDIVVASSNGQRHHLAALWRMTLAERLDKQLRTDTVMAVHRFQEQCRVRAVDWPTAPFDPFFNINTADDLTAADKILSSGAGKGEGTP